MPEYTFEGKLAGSRTSPVKLAEWCHDIGGWRDYELVEAVAICLAESNGYTRAHNTKRFADSGIIVSQDRGLFQIKVDMEDLNSPWGLSMWNVHDNIKHARKMYDRRGWQPWFAWVNNIAFNPAMKGHYIQRATWGVMNLHRKRHGMKQVPSPYVLGGHRRLEKWVRMGAY